MTLTLTPIAHGELCHGSRWTVDDIDVLADRVARVAMGQYRHIASILEGLNVPAPKGSKEHAADAISKMQVSKNGDPWQRDGWLFQIISWIAASHQLQTGSILRPPHIFKAHKGFDGIQLEVSADGNTVIAIVVFEDKATDDPRKTIREDVWPGIAQLEAGERVTELTHEATGLLEAQQHRFPGLNVDEAIDKVFWQEARRYRLSISTGSIHQKDADRARLFVDYDSMAAGDKLRRRAETMHFDDLRPWMSDFSARVITRLKELGNV
ncbi:hypothetical protein GCM10007908_04080 [Rhizobium albus]|nr:hypothetical protein GCM10007908_04080 [Rhizobium albus]